VKTLTTFVIFRTGPAAMHVVLEAEPSPESFQ